MRNKNFKARKVQNPTAPKWVENLMKSSLFGDVSKDGFFAQISSERVTLLILKVSSFDNY